MPVFGAMKPMRSSSAACADAPKAALIASEPPTSSSAAVHDALWFMTIVLPFVRSAKPSGVQTFLA